jgi:hypothetical protein
VSVLPPTVSFILLLPPNLQTVYVCKSRHSVFFVEMLLVVVLCPVECLPSLALDVQACGPVERRDLHTWVVLGNILSINVAGQLEVTVQVILSWRNGHLMLRASLTGSGLAIELLRMLGA